MKARRTRGGWKGYGIDVTFRVPIDFAFTWCTDFSSKDPALEGESYRRKVIVRGPRRVVFEDLEETESGWVWSRDVVRLDPPNRWHMEGIGNRRDVVADYLLTSLSGGRTRLELRWRRRTKMPGQKELSKTQREAGTMHAWRRFRDGMERDFRKSLRARRARLE